MGIAPIKDLIKWRPQKLDDGHNKPEPALLRALNYCLLGVTCKVCFLRRQAVARTRRSRMCCRCS